MSSTWVRGFVSLCCSFYCVSAVAVARIPERDAKGRPHLRSESVIVRRVADGRILLEKSPDTVRPIASVTKLVTLATLVDLGRLPGEEWLTIEEADKDRVKWSRSRFSIGRTFHAQELLQGGILASDNRAIYAVVRNTGLSRAEFVTQMNRVAQGLGMSKSVFKDPAGIDEGNVSTARDLLNLVNAADGIELIRTISGEDKMILTDSRGLDLDLSNTNRLARSGRWHVRVGKTGYTIEAGRTLVLRVVIDETAFDMIFLGSREWASVFGDAGRVRRWLNEKKLGLLPPEHVAEPTRERDEETREASDGAATREVGEVPSAREDREDSEGREAPRSRSREVREGRETQEARAPR